MDTYRAIAFAIGLSLFSIGIGCSGTASTPKARSVQDAAKVLKTKPDEVFRAGKYFLTNAVYQDIRRIAALYKGASATIDADGCSVVGLAGPFDTDYLRKAIKYVGETYVPKGSNVMTGVHTSKALDALCLQKAAKK